jgi:hypothetical protein
MFFQYCLKNGNKEEGENEEKIKERGRTGERGKKMLLQKCSLFIPL